MIKFSHFVRSNKASAERRALEMAPAEERRDGDWRRPNGRGRSITIRQQGTVAHCVRHGSKAFNDPNAISATRHLAESGGGRASADKKGHAIAELAHANAMKRKSVALQLFITIIRRFSFISLQPRAAAYPGDGRLIIS